jgi:hypothetical protein
MQWIEHAMCGLLLGPLRRLGILNIEVERSVCNAALEIVLAVCESYAKVILGGSLLFLWENLGLILFMNLFKSPISVLGFSLIAFLLVFVFMVSGSFIEWSKDSERETETTHLIGLGVVITLVKGVEAVNQFDSRSVLVC